MKRVSAVLAATPRSGLVISVAVVLTSVACGVDKDEEPDSGANTAASVGEERPGLAEADFGDLDASEFGLDLPWGQGNVSKDPPPGGDPTVLAGVRIWRGAAFDRVIFSLSSSLAGYRVARVDTLPADCDISDAVADSPVLLAVSFEHARVAGAGVDPTPTSPSDEAAAGAPVLLGIEAACGGDGRVEWLLGLAEDAEHRIIEMRGEPRLVVDIRHTEGG